MPIDHRRINGPEESVPYELFVRKDFKAIKKYFEKICTNKIRADKRQFGDIRKVCFKSGIVSQAKGSAYIEMGETKVLVSVFDPREIPNRSDYSLKGELYCEFKYATFSCPKRRLHQQDSEEKQYSCIMKKALESAVCLHELPNFQVDIYALVLHNDGSALSAAINGAGLALAQAGVPMYDIITSVTVGIQQGQIVVDPTLSEEQFCQTELLSSDNCNINHGMAVISKLHTHQQICQFYQTGYISLGDIKSVLQILVKSSEILVPLVQKSLLKLVEKNIQV